jgi:hypothetical protein
MQLKDDSNDQEHETLLGYGELHDGLSDMIESGRLTEGMIPDDYQWLVEKLAELGTHWEQETLD